jgi:hypothetical protein
MNERTRSYLMSEEQCNQLNSARKALSGFASLLMCDVKELDTSPEQLGYMLDNISRQLTQAVDHLQY